MTSPSSRRTKGCWALGYGFTVSQLGQSRRVPGLVLEMESGVHRYNLNKHGAAHAGSPELRPSHA